MIDKHSNLLSILDVTDEISILHINEPVPKDAVLPVRLQLLSMWDREHREIPETFQTKLSVEVPGGKVYEQDDSMLAGSLEEHIRTRLIYGVEGIPYAGPGVYWFIIKMAKGQENSFSPAVRVPLEVKMAPEALTLSSSTSPEPPAAPIPAAPRKSSSRRGRGRP